MLLGHLVELELSARFLAVSRVLRDDPLLNGLIETRDKFFEFLLSIFTLACIGVLEELLMCVVQFSLAHGVALASLFVLAIAFSGGAAALDISHFL